MSLSILILAYDVRVKSSSYDLGLGIAIGNLKLKLGVLVCKQHCGAIVDPKNTTTARISLFGINVAQRAQNVH